LPNTTRLKAGDIMKRMIFAVLMLITSIVAVAGDDVTNDGSRVVLPLNAQSCNLPSAPPPIPEPPAKEDLLKAQKLIKQFQGEMEVYRTCLDRDNESGELSQGNQLALGNAYDYSVDMEERVAAMFNESLRSYKAGLAK
jgi:hypothetical protein